MKVFFIPLCDNVLLNTISDTVVLFGVDETGGELQAGSGGRDPDAGRRS